MICWIRIVGWQPPSQEELLCLHCSGQPHPQVERTLSWVISRWSSTKKDNITDKYFPRHKICCHQPGWGVGVPGLDFVSYQASKHQKEVSFLRLSPLKCTIGDVIAYHGARIWFHRFDPRDGLWKARSTKAPTFLATTPNLLGRFCDHLSLITI